MSIQVNEFRHIPGKNDAEYIKLLKEHLEAQKQLTFKAIAKNKELSKSAKSNSSESPNGWIPCTPETMPEEYQDVLVTLSDSSGGFIKEMQFIKGLFEAEDDLYGIIDEKDSVDYAYSF